MDNMKNITQCIAYLGQNPDSNDLLYLYSTEGCKDIEEIIDAIVKNPSLENILKVAYVKGHATYSDNPEDAAFALAQFEFDGGDEDFLGITKKDGEYNVLPLPANIDEINDFVKRTQDGPQATSVKSSPEAPTPDCKEPLVPGIVRVTSRNFKAVVLMEGYDIFIQEFADWCPYCVYMHPYVNDLGWVMNNVPNVKVCKIDCAANNTDDFQDWLQTRGVPNILFLPEAKKRKPRSFRKIQFGQSGESGDPELKVDAMVAFIYRNMSGKRFDEDHCKQRAKLIQGQAGFLAKDASQSLQKAGAKEKMTWIDIIRGNKALERYTGGGCPVLANDDLTETWKELFNAALSYDRKFPDGDQLTGVRAEELVFTKLKHELWAEKLPQAKAMEVLKKAEEKLEAIKQVFSETSKAFIDDNGARPVHFQFQQVRILETDTVNFNYKLSFTLLLSWPLKEKDVEDDGDSEVGKPKSIEDRIWKPPDIVVSNATDDNLEVQVGATKLRLKEETNAKGTHPTFWASEARTVQCVTCASVYSLEDFPFDIQSLELFLSFQGSSDEFVLVKEKDCAAVQYSALNQLAEWTLHPPSCEICYQDYGKQHQDISFNDLSRARQQMNDTKDDIRPSVVLRFPAERGSQPVIWSCGYILAALGLMGNCVFLMDSQSEFGDRVSNILTLFLASCAFQAFIDTNLPKLRYISGFQKYVILMNVYNFLILAEISFSKRFSRTRDDTFFAVMNVGSWIFIHVYIAYYVILVIRPRQKQKIVTMTPRKLLQDLCNARLARNNGEEYEHTRNGLMANNVKDERGTIISFVPKTVFKSKSLILDRFQEDDLTVEEACRRADAIADTDSEVSKTLPLKDGIDQCAANLGARQCLIKRQQTMKTCGPKSGFGAWWKGSLFLKAKELSQEDLEPLWTGIFEAADKNDDGVVDSGEIDQLASNARFSQLLEVMKTSDRNQDGKVDRTEWQGMLRTILTEHGQPSPGLLEQLTMAKDKLLSDKKPAK